MEFNDIGIDSKLDWPRIKKLLTIGLFGAFLNFTGDILLGFGESQESLSGLLKVLPKYTGASDNLIFIAALLGMLGMVLDGLSFFGIYRLIVCKSKDLAHSYRSGILGYIMFGPCGFHVGVCVAVYLYNHCDINIFQDYIKYFILPAFILFWIFFIVLVIVQIKAFISNNTPYPKWCFIFNPITGILFSMLFALFGNTAITNALRCAWLGIGCMFTFGGLLLTMPKEK